MCPRFGEHLDVPRVQNVETAIGEADALALRTPFKVDVVRDRATLARITEDGKLENIYRLQIMNASEQDKAYRLSVRGLDGIALASEPDIQVGPAESRWIVTR